MIKHKFLRTDHPILQVVLDTPLRRQFDYLQPAAGAPGVPGQRVRVPLGKRRAVGVIAAVAGRSEVPAVRLKRAFRIAKLLLRDHDDALDVMQDSMISLARNYAGHPEGQWRPLFYRILRNRITDYQRRRRVRQGVIAWWPGSARDQEQPDPVEEAPDPSGAPDQVL